MSKTSQDTEAKWILDYGVEWSEWQQSISNWLSKQTKSMSPRLTAISIFFKKYLYDNELPKNFIDFFSNTESFPDLYTTMKADLSNNRTALYRYNIIMDLLNSIIMEHFSYLDDFGKPIPKISNPFPVLDDENYSPAVRSIETTYSSLPFKYIKELRGIICPETKGDFKDWLWAIDSSDRGDWFDVQEGVVDPDDPDCVWRTNGKRKQLWCPVKAMVIYLKLHLPLRTYQTRMLDSGEADYYRYSKGLWSINTTHLFTNPRKSISKGFFHKMTDRATGLDIVGMFISTNKTQDINKDEVDRGYAIPWQHEEVLYWVEKLRN